MARHGLRFLWWLGFNMSVAVAVGFIALAGVATETGVVMLIYLDQALAEVKVEREAAGRLFTKADLAEAIMRGAAERVRPKMMTVVAIMVGLLPILWSTGTGSEVMRPIAVPMIGGMVSSTVLTAYGDPGRLHVGEGMGAAERGGPARREGRCAAARNPARRRVKGRCGGDCGAAVDRALAACVAGLEPAPRRARVRMGDFYIRPLPEGRGFSRSHV